MIQKPDIFTFDIRKLSLFKGNEKTEHTNINSLAANCWFHFPQRSDVTINFFKYLSEANSFHISAIWKGTVLDQTYWHQDTNNFISVIGKYPSLGFKVVNEKGELLKRFQVSFSSKEIYDECCKCVEEKLQVPLNQMDASHMGENSQIIDYPNQGFSRALPTPKGIKNSGENVSNSQSYYQASQALCRPQYIPQQSQLRTLPQLERPLYLPDLSVDKRQPQQFESQQQLHTKYLLQSQQSQNSYSQFHPNYTYLVTSPSQQNGVISDQSIQHHRIPFAAPQICCLDSLIPSNTSHVPLISELLLKSKKIDTHHYVKDPVPESYDYRKNNIEPRIRRNDADISCEKAVIKKKCVIKEEEMLPMKVGKEFNTPNELTKETPKALKNVQRAILKIDLLRMKDSELKKLVTERLKDQEFVKFVEKLNKIVSQP